MSPRKIIVFGATGKQGGSVVRALAADNNYEVVGITRNPDSAGAKGVYHKIGYSVTDWGSRGCRSWRDGH